MSPRTRVLGAAALLSLAVTSAAAAAPRHIAYTAGQLGNATGAWR